MKCAVADVARTKKTPRRVCLAKTSASSSTLNKLLNRILRPNLATALMVALGTIYDTWLENFNNLMSLPLEFYPLYAVNLEIKHVYGLFIYVTHILHKTDLIELFYVPNMLNCL